MKHLFLTAGLLLSATVTHAEIKDIPAKNCEAFIDKIATWNGTYGYQGFSVYIKTLNARLDGPIKAVKFHRNIQETEASKKACAQLNGSYDPHQCSEIGKWIDSPFEEFFSNDYYVIHFDEYHVNTFDHVYRGAFFVETTKGTRYWVNALSGDGNFTFDDRLHDNLISEGGGGYRREGRKQPTQSSAGVMEYLNPQQCR